jgi:hypothetical protein
VGGGHDGTASVPAARESATRYARTSAKSTTTRVNITVRTTELRRRPTSSLCAAMAGSFGVGVGLAPTLGPCGQHAIGAVPEISERPHVKQLTTSVERPTTGGPCRPACRQGWAAAGSSETRRRFVRRRGDGFSQRCAYQRAHFRTCEDPAQAMTTVIRQPSSGPHTCRGCGRAVAVRNGAAKISAAQKHSGGPGWT